MTVQSRDVRSFVSEAIVREPTHTQWLAGRMPGSWEGVMSETNSISLSDS
jgi:hypothetical protein